MTRFARLQAASRVLGWVVAIGALAVIVFGWLLGFEDVASILPGRVTMKFNLALGMLLVGGGTVALAERRSRWISDSMGFVALVIGFVTIVQYAFDLSSTGFDEFFVRDFPDAVATPDPGRMGLNSAVNLVLLGAGIGYHGRRIVVSRVLTVGAGIVAYLAFVGYILDVPRLAGVSGATPMSFATAILMMCAVVGLTLLQPPELIVTDALGGAIARRFIPGTLVGITGLVAVIRWTLAEMLEDPLFAVQLTVVLVITAAMIATAAIAQRVNRLSEDLRIAESQLRAANDELSRFASVAAHDLRAPLRKIGNFLERARVSFDRGERERSKDYLERAEETTGRMYELLEDILALGQIDRSEKKIEPVQIKKVVEQVVDDLADRGARGAVRTNALPTLPADPAQMYLLFANLISNALKYAHPDRPAQIVVSGRSTGDGVHEISVTDNGIGFDPTVGSRLFEPFERGDAGALEGSGIGLAVCRRIVETHGGGIRADSAEGMGSTFTVRLPSRQRREGSHRS